MNTILLISEQYIKENSPVYDSVDPKVLRSHIFESQNINLRYILPSDLYDDIFTQMNAYKDYLAGGGTDPVEDQVDARIINLIDNAKAMLLYFTLYNAAYSLYTRITNKGINTESSDYSQDVDFSLLEKMRVDWRNKAESYGTLLVEYLEDNIDDYPEMSSEDCDIETTSLFNNPLYLGDEI